MPRHPEKKQLTIKEPFLRFFCVASLFLGIALPSGTAHATTYTWKGTVSSLVNTATNWLPAGLPGVGDTVVVATNTVLNITSNLVVSRLTLGPGSILQGSGNITVTDYLSVQDATLNGLGDIILPTTATADFSSSATTLFLFKNNKINKDVYNSGTIRLLSGNLVLGANLLNDSGSTFDFRSDGSITRAALTAPVFTNNGTLLKSAGSGTSNIAPDFINNGIVRSLSGTLGLGNRYVQQAGTTSLDGGNLAASGPIVISGGKLAGTGFIDGDVVNNGDGHVGPGHSPGSIVINGNYIQTGNGALDIEIGGPNPGTQFDQLTVNGDASLGGMLNIIQYGNYLPVEGSNYEVLDYYSGAGNFASINFQFPSSPLVFTTTLTPMYLVATASKPSTSLPVAAVSNPANRAVVTSLSSATGTASGGSGVNAVTVQLYRYGNAATAAGYWAGGTTWSSAYNAATNERAASGTANWTLTPPSMVYGEYSLRPTAKDSAGKASLSDSIHFFKSLGSSTVALSTAIAKVSSSSIQLKFTKALDSKYAVDSSHYDVIRTANGAPLSLQSIAYNSSTSTVTLNLLGGALVSGDKVTVAVNNMFDSTGKILSKQSSSLTAS